MSALLCLLLVVGAPDSELDELEALQRVIRDAMRTASPSVVTIETVGGIRQIQIPDNLKSKMTLPERPREDDRNAPEDDGEPDDVVPPEGRTPRFKDEWRKMLAAPGFQKAEGPTTGLIISEDGYVVTSAWNFEGNPNVVTVTTDKGKLYAAKLLGIDRAAGLALLKIDAAGLPVPTFIDPGTVRVGAWAFALGRAVARSHVSVKYGVISALNRIEGNALQTDAATNPTNYGGPLIDVEGRVYGIIVPLGARGEEANPNWYDSGIGFVAPIRDPAKLIERLKKPDTVLLAAFLGVQTDKDRTEEGALVQQIVPEHAAAKAGLRPKDIVLAVDGTPIHNAFTLRFEIGRRRAGDKVALSVRRGDETLALVATLGERPKPKAKEKIPIPIPGGAKTPKPGR